MRTVLRLLPLSLLACSVLNAQTKSQDYSAVLRSGTVVEAMFSGGIADVQVHRLGPMEVVELTIPAREGQAQEIHVRHLFDVKAHKVYMNDLARRTCSWMTYTPTDMPAAYDPLSFPPPPPDEKAKAAKAPRESVNGVPAWVDTQDGPMGKMKMWVAVDGDFPVKMELTREDGKAITLLEVKSIRHEKPDAALLAVPANCSTQAQGQWTEEGISAHGEANIDASASGSVNLETGETKSSADVKTTTKPQ
jgi:hypothetical protein